MNSLYDKIWITRKCRILLEERLLGYSRITEWIIPFYSIVLIALSVFPRPVEQALTLFLSVCGSVVILAVSILVAAKKFELRALQIKQHYVHLEALLARIPVSTPEEIALVAREYFREVDSSENHSNRDYIKLLVQQRRNPKSTLDKPSRSQIIKHYFVNWCEYLGVLALFLAPVILLVVALT